MKIACLQFAPKVGEVDNNLNRADSVLSKVDRAELAQLDLLVLPELAFTGYNFKSLQHISPFLEPSGSGISSLWARTTALKYNCNVTVGYPEKVDVTASWPTSPEYYNSAIVVSGEGETVANYRKSFLYMVDETWALEGRDGFFEGYIPGLGNTAIGICMDLNPYRFEAPWHLFEFGFHILEVEANLVVLSMAWLTREDGRVFSRMPQEPDMDTLTYWVQRLEPVIRAEKTEEIIVVFCNRTGVEDGVVYAGTSAVIGIKDGEVNVYGVLGRGVKELLIVDTDKPPLGKLVNRPEGLEADTAPSNTGASPSSPNPKAEDSPLPTDHSPKASPSSESSPSPRPNAPNISTAPPWQNQTLPARKTRPFSPKLQIPIFPPIPYLAPDGSSSATSDNVKTPTAPSPTPLKLRPIIPFAHPGPKGHSLTPYPSADGKSLAFIYPEFDSLGSEKVQGMSPISVQHSPLEIRWVIPRQDLLTPAQPEKAQEKSDAQSDASITAICDRLVSQLPHSIGTPIEDLDGSDSGDRVGRPAEIVGIPERPESPKSRNTSRSGHRDTTAADSQPTDMTELNRMLDVVLGRLGGGDSPFRPAASQGSDQQSRPSSIFRDSIPIGLGPDLLRQPSAHRPQSIAFFRPSSRLGKEKGESIEPVPLSRFNPQERRSKSLSGPDSERPRPRSYTVLAQEGPIAGPESPRTQTGPLPPSKGLVNRNDSDSRTVSRGRQRQFKTSPPTTSQSFGLKQDRKYSRGRSREKRSTSGHHTQKSGRLPDVPLSPSDEIIASISRVCHHCPVHGRDSPAASNHQENLYQVSLPFSLNKLRKESAGTPPSFRASSARAPSVNSLRSPQKPRTPQFDPPTPKAMEFAEDVLQSSPSPNALIIAEDALLHQLDVAYPAYQTQSVVL